MYEELISILEYFCGELTHEQKVMATYHDSKGQLIGIGRAVGRMAYMPLVTRDGKSCSVIDGAGYEQVASIDGRRSLENIIKTYRHEKGQQPCQPSK